MAKPVQIVQTSVTLDLSEQVVSTINAATNSPDLSKFLKPLLENYLLNYSQGGFLLKSTDVSRISKSAGKNIDSAAAVVDVVENAVQKKGYEYQFQVGIDPALVEPLQDMARMRGVTFQELIQDCWDTANSQGWFYALPETCLNLYFTSEQKAEICKMVGKSNITGDDVFKLLKKVK